MGKERRGGGGEEERSRPRAPIGSRTGSNKGRNNPGLVENDPAIHHVATGSNRSERSTPQHGGTVRKKQPRHATKLEDCGVDIQERSSHIYPQERE